MRRDNGLLARFRAGLRELEEFLIEQRPEIVTDLNLQAGEDPVVVREVVLPLLRTLRQETSLGLSVGLGSLDAALYRDLREAGASVYVLKFETATPNHYQAVRAPGSLAERLEHVRLLAEQGWHVSSGFIAGLPGATPDQLLDCFETARTLPLCGCSVSPFVPGENTPLAAGPAGDVELALNCMAALRLMRPDWVIPAVSALNLNNGGNGSSAYGRGLCAGANLVTLNLTPPGLRDDYLIYKRRRFIITEEYICRAIEASGRRPSPRGLAEFLDEARANRRATRPSAAPS
jgi:biotin synthase